MQPPPGPPDIAHRFRRTHPAWFKLVRRPAFLAVTSALVAAYALLVLPQPGNTSPAWLYSSITLCLLVLFTLGWSALILAGQ